MIYYKLTQDNFWDYYVEENPNLDSEITFLAGKPIPESSIKTPLIFEISGPVELDSKVSPGHFLGDVIPIVSQQFIDLLKKVGIDNFQAFPAILNITSEKLQWTSYFAFNVVGLIDAVDSSRSKSDTIMDGDDIPDLVDYEEMVLDQKKVKNFKMFRELYSGILIVDDSLGQGLIGNKPKEGSWHIDLEEIDTIN